MLVLGWIGCAARTAMVLEPPLAAIDGFALVGVTVWTGDGSPPRPEHTLVVRDGRIVSVAPTGNAVLPSGIRMLPGDGLFVMPGLADMHAHLPDAEPDDTITTERALALQLARGVTTVRSMRGTPAQLVLRDRIAAGEVQGPRLLVGAPVGDLVAADVPAAVAEIAGAGYDFVKLMGGVDPDAYRALVDAVAAHGLHLAGHVPPEIPLDAVLAGGQCIEHLHGGAAAVRAGTRPAEIAARMQQAGLWNCPTLDYAAVTGGIIGLEALEARPGLALVPAADRARWQAEIAGRSADDTEAFREEYARRQQLVVALAEAGAGLLATGNHGPFMVPGFGMREELARWEEAGVSRERALVAASQGAAAAWIGADDWGSLAVGHVADLLVLEGSPLDDLDRLSAIHGVVRAGAWLDPSELEAALPP